MGLSIESGANVNCVEDQCNPQCIQLNFAPEQIKQMKHDITGFMPVIINR